MRIILNGKQTEVSSDVTISTLLKSNDFPEEAVLIEHNGAIVPQEEWANTELRTGDKLEILHFVGGG